MSFFRRHRPVVGAVIEPVDFERYPSLEDYAFALMAAATPTAVARERLRQARSHFDERRAGDWQSVGPEESSAAREDAAWAAAGVLLRQVGAEPEEDPYLWTGIPRQPTVSAPSLFGPWSG